MTKRLLDEIYARYNRREFVHPDPLEFLYRYDDPTDREVVGLVASSLAYGRVKQILASVSNALERMGPSPRSFLVKASRQRLEKGFAGFRHRFTSGAEMACLLTGAGAAIRRHGSLGTLFSTNLRPGDKTVLPAMGAFVSELSGETCLKGLLPHPEGGSACKRLNMYLRWMVRSDDVDPGGWRGVGPERLVVPLDTHLFKIGRALGFTRRKAADLKAALEITAEFSKISPGDPVRYDFALTRFGIREETDMGAFLKSLAKAKAIR